MRPIKETYEIDRPTKETGKPPVKETCAIHIHIHIHMYIYICIHAYIDAMRSIISRGQSDRHAHK